MWLDSRLDLADGESAPQNREKDAVKDNQTLDSAIPFPPGYAEYVEEDEA